METGSLGMHWSAVPHDDISISEENMRNFTEDSGLLVKI
jgi:hypothetical protein